MVTKEDLSVSHYNS